MEESSAAANHHVVLAAKVVGKASARIEFRLGAIQYVGWKRFKLIAQAGVQSQIGS